MVTYKELAECDIEAALILYNSNLRAYNTCAMHCRQCAEKYLKQLLMKYFSSISKEITREELIETMSGHSLKRLMHFCTKYTRGLSKIRAQIVILNDYYTNVSYPGDDYIEVDRRLAKELLDSALLVRECCIELLKH